MKWSAFSRAAEDLRTKVNRPDFIDLAESLAWQIENSQKFYFPAGVDLIDGKSHSDLIDFYRLPYPLISILHEVEMDGHGSAPAIAVAHEITDEWRGLLQGDDTYFPDGSWIALTSALYRSDLDLWCPGPSVIVCKNELTPGVWGTQQFLPQKHPITEAYCREKGAERIATEMQIDLHVVCNLCVMLGMANVEPVLVQAPKAVNKKRAAKGKPLLYDYHVLKVDGERWESSEREVSGDKRFTRSHLRRGHIRNIAGGRKIWVRATYVHGRVNGFVNKDYEVVA